MGRVEEPLVNGLFSPMHAGALQRRMLRAARFPVAGPLLEIGCGNGRTTAALARRLPRIEITAIDYDAGQATRALRRLGTRARIEEADATHLPFADASFATVVEMNAFHHILDWRAALRETRRVLTPDGQFLFTDYTRRFVWGALARAPYQPGLFTREEFARGLDDAGFRARRLEGEWIIVGRAEA